MRGERFRALTLLVALVLSPKARAQTAAAPEASAAPPAADKWKLTPYGILFFNGFDNSGGTNNGDVPLWATGGSANASASARQSRLGLKLSGLRAAGGKLSGIAEVDFYGGFPAVGIGDNMGVVRLRLASARIDWEHTTLLVGQDWMVFAPANPVSLACAGIPLMAASGNPWARLPQVRLERRQGVLTLQAAVLAASTGDFSSAFLYQPATGALSQTPFLQARAAVSAKNAYGTGKPASFGVSGHYGRAKVLGTAGASDATVDSAAASADFSLPLGGRVSLAAEGFAGKNLAGFQAGVFQGLNPDYGVAGPSGITLVGPQSIETKGGWAQLAATAVPGHLSFYGTYGVDDPKDADLVSVSKTNWRSRNRSYALSFIHKVTPQASWGIEVRRIDTRFLETGSKRDTQVNLATTLEF